jgi:hypothetical protein
LLGLAEAQIVAGLERSERGDARQDDAGAAARLDQRSRKRRRGALGRQIDRRLRQFERPAVAGKARDQLAAEQRAGERGQKRRAGGNGKDVGGGQGGLGGRVASR